MDRNRIAELERLADQHRKAGEFEQAIATLSDLLRLDEAFVRGHLAIAMLYQKVEQHDLAVQHAERAVELEPTDGLNFTALSIVYQRAFEATRDPQYIQKAEMAKARAFG
jgi:tetratricopeptide (TPR) repeat protein